MSNIVEFDTLVEMSKETLVAKLAKDWKFYAGELKRYEEAEEVARKMLIMACEGKDYEGCGVKVEQIERKGSVEYKAIPELADVNLEDYRKPSTVYWTVKPSVKE